MDLHDQCTRDDPDPKEKAASFLSVQLSSNCELHQLENGQVTAVGNVGAANTYVFSHVIDSSNLTTKQQGETCGGFLWTDGVCADDFSCFTRDNSGCGRYCVPNDKKGWDCGGGIDCGKGLECCVTGTDQFPAKDGFPCLNNYYCICYPSDLCFEI